MTTPRTIVDEDLPITRIVVTGDLNTERVVVDVDDQPRLTVTNTGEDIVVSVFTSAAGVNSVNGLQGDVTLTTTNIAEGTNLYYTTVRANADFDARFPGAFDTRLATKTTTNLAEGTNLYYTDARVDAYVRGGELDSIRIDTTPENTTAPAAGEFKYNTSYGVPDIGLPNDGTISLGIDSVAYVTNAEATTISKGQVVYLFGAQGDRASVKLAYNTSDATSSKTFGIAKQDIAAGGAGYVVTQGVVSNLNLGAYQPGDILWLGSTPGSFTTTKAVAPAHLVFIGVVERANNGNGLLYVKPQNGYELDEIHDVLINGKTAGQFIRRNSANTLWINETVDTDDIGEGATNQYFTTQRARDSFSAGNNIVITNGVVSTVTEPDFTTVTVTEAPASGLYVTNKTYVDGAISSAIGAINYPVDSVNGQTNTVVLDTDDISEGTTNLYYTNARADARVAIGIANLVDSAPATLDTLNELAAALGDDPNFATTITTALGTKLATADFTSTADTWLATKSTTNLGEGTNLYYTNTRARGAISVSYGGTTPGLTYDNSTGVLTYLAPTTDDVDEGISNLYYTDARADARIAAASINDLSDVVITSVAPGQMIYYNGTNWINSATVNSANINRFSRTADGTGNNAIIALSRNRADAARAVDNGPWLAFEYVGTDNTQATSVQNVIRSRYQTSGNHQLQFLQLAGDYATPTVMAQLQRGSYFLNSTTGYQSLLLTDAVLTTRANTVTLANSGNTVNYALFGASGHTIGGVDSVTTFTRASGANVGTRPVAILRNSVTATTTPATNDGASYRLQAAGSNGTAYNLAQISGVYSSTGDTSITFDIANGDQTTGIMTVVQPLVSKLSGTTIRATASPTATPGGNTLTDIASFTPTKVQLGAPLAYPSYTTTQRDALTPSAGWVLWNTTDTKLQVYNGTEWADLH